MVENYIFVATTGRSGTDSLTNIFKAADKAVSLHEPHPIMLQDIPPSQNPVSVFKKQFNTLKRIYIKRAAAGHRYYVETNHQFIKTFAIPAAAELGSKLKVIHLVRDTIKVALSFYSIDSIPGATERGKLYLLDPFQRDNILYLPDLFKDGAEFNHPLYRCLWYWYEVEARISRFKEQFPHVPIYKIQTHELNDAHKLSEMFEVLGVDFNPLALRELVGTRTNLKSQEKKKVLDTDGVAEMNDRLLSVLSDRFDMNFL